MTMREFCLDVLGVRWTGPRPSDLDSSGTRLRARVPQERWPFGPASHHEGCCELQRGGLYCDCKASDQSDVEWGMS